MESLKEMTYEEKVAKSQVSWDKFSFAYFTTLNKNSLSLMCTLMALTRTHKKNTILDSGCGPGLGTKQITTDVPNINSTIYAIDFSNEMIKFSEKVFSDYDDFNANTNNHWEIATNESEVKINVEKDVEEIRKSKIGKVVKFYQGNAENLFFEDEQFDIYLSNLLLMLCVDVDKAIAECFRVLKNDGVAAFSIWGKKEETKLCWKIFEDVLMKFGIDTTKDRSSFWLAEDVEGLKARFLKAGFKDVRIEYTFEIYDCFDEQDYLIKFKGPRVNALFDAMKDDKKVSEIVEEVLNEARREIVEKKQMPTLCSMIILAFK